MQEKRAHRRTPLRSELTCKLPSGATFAGTSRDISLGGMFIETTERPTFGTALEIMATLPGTLGAVRLPGIVRWTGPDGIGVQFGLLGARETHAITKVIKPSS